VALIMEAKSSSETSVLTRLQKRDIPEDSTLQPYIYLHNIAFKAVFSDSDTFPTFIILSKAFLESVCRYLCSALVTFASVSLALVDPCLSENVLVVQTGKRQELRAIWWMLG
jgi:hypothetical protein